jgi:hypothetical protein
LGVLKHLEKEARIRHACSLLVHGERTRDPSKMAPLQVQLVMKYP